jgi:hypothetical protein
MVVLLTDGSDHMILLSLHQRKLISQAADRLPERQRGEFVSQVARRLSECRKYHDHDVTRACRLALRAIERTAA